MDMLTGSPKAPSKAILLSLAIFSLYCWGYAAASQLMVFIYIGDESMVGEEFWKSRRSHRSTIEDQTLPMELPGPLDAWATGQPEEIILESPYSGRVEVALHLRESHDASPPVLGVYANGKMQARLEVPKGTGFQIKKWRVGKKSDLFAEVMLNEAAGSTPEITIRSESGSWAVFESVEIRKLPPVWVKLAGAALLLFWICYGVYWIMSAGAWKTAAINAALILLSTVFALFAVEAFLRLFIPQRIYPLNIVSPFKADSDVEHLLVENVVSPMGFDTNRFGMRDYDRYSKTKPQGVYRILALGDSFTFGTTMLEDTWPKILERMFEGSDPKVEVLNAGVSGYGQDNEYFYLKKYGLDFQPDMVFIAFFNGNDIGDNCEHNTRVVIDGALVNAEAAKKMQAQEISQERKKQIFLNSFHLYRLLKYRNYGGVTRHFQRQSKKVREQLAEEKPNCMAYENPYAYKPFETWEADVKPCWKQTIDYIDKIKDLAAQNRMEMAMAILPGVAQFKSAETEKLWATTKDFDPAYPQKMIMEESAKMGWRVLDAFPYMDSGWDRTTSIHACEDVHYNATGNRLLAEAIFGWMMKEKMIPFNKPPQKPELTEPAKR